MAWTKALPRSEHPAFIADVLDRYEGIDETGRPGLFQFYQMEVALRPADGGQAEALLIGATPRRARRRS